MICHDTVCLPVITLFVRLETSCSHCCDLAVNCFTCHNSQMPRATHTMLLAQRALHSPCLGPLSKVCRSLDNENAPVQYESCIPLRICAETSLSVPNGRSLCCMGLTSSKTKFWNGTPSPQSIPALDPCPTPKPQLSRATPLKCAQKLGQRCGRKDPPVSP